MGRRKIAIAPIEDDRNRSVTFFKRKAGLLKKAHELAVLCKVDVALVIRVKDNKYYEYGSKDIDDILKNYSKDEVIDSKHPGDFVEPPRRPRSSRHTRNQSSTSQISMSEDQSDSMDEEDSHHDSGVDMNNQNEPAWATRARMSRQAHEQQLSGSQSGRPGRASNGSSPQSIGGSSPAVHTGTHRKTRSSSAAPLGRQRIAESAGKSPMPGLSAQKELGSPALVQRQQFNLGHPQTGAKMPPQIKNEPVRKSPLPAGPPHQLQHQQGMMQPLPPPGIGFRPKDQQTQQGQAGQRQYQMSQYALDQHGYNEAQSPSLAGVARPKLKVEIPNDAVNRPGGAAGGVSGNWPDNSISPSGYLLSSQIVPEPASRLPLGSGEKTPLSASLPSRYLNDMLPSPSNLFTNDWGAPWSGLPESAGGRRQGQPSAGGQTPSLGMPSALPGLTPGGFGTTARGIAGDAALAMQAATQQYQNQQMRQHQQQLQMQMQQGQMPLPMQIPQSPPRSMGMGSVGMQRAGTPPMKRHKPN